MRRREFVAVLGGAMVIQSRTARAQQPLLPVIGFLNSASPGPFAHLVAAFRQGLKENGHTEGQNVAIEYRWAEGQYAQLPVLAADLVRRRVTVLVATGGEASALAAKAATPSIPIVFAMGGDPVKVGLVASLNRPEGNITGVTQLTHELTAKRLGLLHELAPQATAIAILANPSNRDAKNQLRDAEDAGARAGVRLVTLTAKAEGEFEAAFATLRQQQAGALLVSADPYFNSRRAELVALAARHRVPTMYEFREFTAAGGLMSYGTDLAGAYRQVGVYTGRILKGAKPADLPIVQSTKFELVINLKTAKSLGITIPQSLLLRADDVIQ